MLRDKTITCKDCGSEFTFTAKDQEFFAEKGFDNEPQRCKPCRDARKGDSRKGGSGPRAGSGGAGGPREMFDAVCSECGKSCKVPFQPRDGRPVLCSDCFRR